MSKKIELSGYHREKQHRKEYYLKYVYGWKLRRCTACSGSGVYDTNGSPKCGACNGTGKERYKSLKVEY